MARIAKKESNILDNMPDEASPLVSGIEHERLNFVGGGLWRYRTVKDEVYARKPEAYFAAKRDLGMRSGDIVLVHDGGEVALVAV